MKESEIIDILRSEDDEFRKLEQEHKSLENSLNDLSKKKHLTSEEEVSKKKIQKQKLQGKDRMAQLIKEYNK